MRQYQVVVLGSDGPEAGQLRRTLLARFSELHLDAGLLRFLTPTDLGTLDRAAPVVGVYFGLESSQPGADAAVESLIADGYVTVPIVHNLEHYRDSVPISLHATNGCALRADDPDLDEIAGVVLENLRLLRKSRRVFISYRREESRGAAIQLYEELDSRTFDVFLDTLSIRPAEPFQEVLWHRLADTDVMVLLDSPGFLDSRWTEAELVRANSTSLQILQVIWPDHTQAARAAFSLVHQLCDSDFHDPGNLIGPEARVSAKMISALALEVEQLRARALAARQAYLVREMFREATNLGGALIAQPGGYLELPYPNGGKAIIVPTVGVPDAVRYQEIEEDLAMHSGAELFLVYDDRGVRDRWLKHLSWLDPVMRVRSVPIRDANTWMAARLSP